MLQWVLAELTNKANFKLFRALALFGGSILFFRLVQCWPRPICWVVDVTLLHVLPWRSETCRQLITTTSPSLLSCAHAGTLERLCSAREAHTG